MRFIAYDTETTGLDAYHGTKPFLVTIAYENGEIEYWEWDVDPFTRQPKIPKRDIKEIKSIIAKHKVIMQNSKFDVLMSETIGIDNWDWDNIYDTVLMAHLVNSQKPKDLTSLAMEYLSVDLSEYDNHSNDVVNKARNLARKQFPEWLIASKELNCMPSAKEKVWKLDLWLPRAIAKELEYPEDHEYWTSTSSYANTDSEATLLVFKALRDQIEEEGLWKLYEARRSVLPIIYNMEKVGVTLTDKRMKTMQKKYRKESKRAGMICKNIATNYGFDLELPKGGVNNSLREFCFEILELEPRDRSKKTKAPSLNSKNVIPYYLETLEGKPLKFIKNLADKRKRDTALTYMEGYCRFMLPYKDREGWFVLHPSVNPTGTATLRSSSKNPNEQNISKKEGFNLRYIFGPAPGREWWSLDYNNLELRIPAYECQEPAMLELFENPDSAPYYGSYHLLIFSILYPDEFQKYGAEVKDKYKSTLYQWTKNGNFAELYGAVDTLDGKSTADRAFHYPGAQTIVANKLQRKAALNEEWIDFADEHGYVTTMPDKTIDPNNGYPLVCPRVWRGNRTSISPTIPLNYHVQGTACWVKCQAMVKVNSILPPGHHIIMDVHDELVFDFPKKKNMGNLPLIKKVKERMESCGDDINVPLTCGVDYHPNNWSESVGVTI